MHIREVGPEDGYKSYQCRTKHRLTGEARLSATKGRLVITGMILHLYKITILSREYIVVGIIEFVCLIIRLIRRR